MAVLSRRVGKVTVYALTDGSGTFFEPREQAFTATAEQWAAADAFDPGAVLSDGQWNLQFRCFALRLEDGQVILVDAGIGPADAPAKAWAPVPGRLPQELAEAGIDPGEVSHVILTHLHTDHIGWAVSGLLPNALHILQESEVDALERPGLLDPIQDQLRLVRGDVSVTGPVHIVATPGHTPGHQTVLVDSCDKLMAVTGDLLVNSVQLLAPQVAYSHEMDADTACRSRTSLLARVARRQGYLATPHLTEPFVAARL